MKINLIPIIILVSIIFGFLVLKSLSNQKIIDENNTTDKISKTVLFSLQRNQFETISSLHCEPESWQAQTDYDSFLKLYIDNYQKFDWSNSFLQLNDNSFTIQKIKNLKKGEIFEDYFTVKRQNAATR